MLLYRVIKFKHSFKTNSHAGQDLLVTHVTSNKENGYYVEVGSSHPKNVNNIYLLEKTLNWKRVSLASLGEWEGFEDWRVDISGCPQFNFKDTVDNPRWISLFNFNQKFKFCVYFGVLKIRLKKNERRIILSLFMIPYRYIGRIIK